MRSGSTLLKALLAEADDISHLPEVDFQRYQNWRTARSRIEALHPKPIVVLKRPAWYHEARSYPRLPAVSPLKIIVLVRDVHDTVVSLRLMTFGSMSRIVAPAANRYLVEYWARVNSRLGDVVDHPGAGKGGTTGRTRAMRRCDEAMLVRYEDLVSRPLSVTQAILAFIGSARQTGVDSYRAPQGFQWQWGRDDGGPRIRDLRVVPSPEHACRDDALLVAIRASRRARTVRRRLNYPELWA
jgi:hypothetical protein